MSEIVIDIIANITGFITYFAPGYIFISCFNYASCLKRENEIEYLIIKSISISYLFYVLTNYAGSIVKLDTLTIQAIIFIEAVMLGLVLGRGRRIQWINKISLFLFKREIANNLFVELWEMANDTNSIVCVTFTMKDNLGIYEGQIHKILSYNDDPEIMLSYYVCYDYNMSVISNYLNVENASLLVRYSDIQKFEWELVPIYDEVAL